MYLQKRTEVCCFSSDVQSQAGLSRGASWPAQWYRGVGALYLSVPACALQYKSPGPLYLPWQRGLFVLDDPSRWSWCGASNVVHCYRRKDCGRVVTICQQRKRCSVQGGKEERTSVVFAGLCVCVYVCVRACVQGVGWTKSADIVYRRHFLSADIIYLLSVESRRSEWRD